MTGWIMGMYKKSLKIPDILHKFNYILSTDIKFQFCFRWWIFWGHLIEIFERAKRINWVVNEMKCRDMSKKLNLTWAWDFFASFSSLVVSTLWKHHKYYVAPFRCTTVFCDETRSIMHETRDALDGETV